jgi:hypothetical protein
MKSPNGNAEQFESLIAQQAGSNPEDDLELEKIRRENLRKSREQENEDQIKNQMIRIYSTTLAIDEIEETTFSKYFDSNVDLLEFMGGILNAYDKNMISGDGPIENWDEQKNQLLSAVRKMDSKFDTKCHNLLLENSGFLDHLVNLLMNLQRMSAANIRENFKLTKMGLNS